MVRGGIGRAQAVGVQEPSSPQVAITGLGVVCPLGNSLSAALGRARAGASGIRAYTSPWLAPDHPQHHRVGGTVVDFEPDPHLEPRFAARQEPGVLYALAAAAEAMADAGLADAVDDARDRFGCVVGAGLAGAELWHRALATAFAGDGADAIPRLTAISITGTAVTGLLALQHQLRGPSWGVANACASGTSAIALAADQIRLGRADAMLVGGCESSMRSIAAYASFVASGMHVTREPHAACAPFARGRRGFVLAEGAGMLVLERLDRARARGAHVYALVAGAAVVNDAHHVINPEPTGQAWARAMRLARRPAVARRGFAAAARGTDVRRGAARRARSAVACRGRAAVPLGAAGPAGGRRGAAGCRGARRGAAPGAGPRSAAARCATGRTPA